MVEIISPEFKRSMKQKLRMLKAKPELKGHPEFKDKPIDWTGAFAFVLIAAYLLRRK